MRPEMIKILEEIFTNEHVSQEAKELGTKLMVEELCPDDGWQDPLNFEPCAQLPTGGWIRRRAYIKACRAVKEGEKIKAIKLLRDPNNAAQSLSLTEAKNFVETHWDEMEK